MLLEEGLYYAEYQRVLEQEENYINELFSDFVAYRSPSNRDSLLRNRDGYLQTISCLKQLILDKTEEASGQSAETYAHYNRIQNLLHEVTRQEEVVSRITKFLDAQETQNEIFAKNVIHQVERLKSQPQDLNADSIVEPSHSMEVGQQPEAQAHTVDHLRITIDDLDRSNGPIGVGKLLEVTKYQARSSITRAAEKALEKAKETGPANFPILLDELITTDGKQYAIVDRQGAYPGGGWRFQAVCSPQPPTQQLP